MSITVPYWQKSIIEDMARDLQQRYATWKGAPLSLPINTDEIVEKFLQLRLELEDLRHRLNMPDVLGATWFEEKCIRIDSSLEEKEGRLSFTMAHEIGHWWMHRPIYEMNKVTVPLFVCEAGKPPSPAVVCRSSGKKQPAEWQADQFAAMLLMPAFLMRTALKSIHTTGSMTVDNLNDFENVALNQNLRKVSKIFIDELGFSNVSVDAMCYRLADLNLVTDSANQQGILF
jgi:Zn-dependent peptidase ImmA (M78 family)